MKVMVHRKRLGAEVPVRATEYSRRKCKERKQRRGERQQAAATGRAMPAKKARVERKAGWGGSHTPMTMREPEKKK